MTDADNEEAKYRCPESARLLNLPYFHRVPNQDGVLYFSESECYEHTSQICRASCNYTFLFGWHYDLLQSIGEEYDFTLISQAKSTNDNIHIVTTTVRGFLRSETGTIAIWHFAHPKTIIPSALVLAQERCVATSHTFTGDRFFLVRSENQTFGYPIDQFNTVKHFIQSLNYHLHTPFENFNVDLETGIFIIKASWVYVAISGIKGEFVEEEERVRLSEKLAEAQPFFEYKAPIKIDWKALAMPQDANFEELCRQLLLKEPSINKAVPIGKTRASDRGRDLEVDEKPSSFLESKNTKWLVQCKFSEKSISPNTISGWTDRVLEHGYDGFWLMTNNDITPDLFDQFKGVEQNTDIKVRFWQRGDFQIKLNVYSELLKNSDFFND